MARDLAAVEEVCALTDAERAALSRLAAADRDPAAASGRALPEAIAPGNRTLGVMLPYTPLHHLLFAGAPYSLLVMTSGNLSEEPIVVRQRGGPANGWPAWPTGSCCTTATSTCARTIRWCASSQARSACCGARAGMRPQTLDLGRAVPELLACGGELKNTFCLTKGRHAILSQHIGDLENYETLVFFEETLANLKKLFRVAPRAVAHDLHPLYLSTQVRAGDAGSAEDRRAAPPRARRELHGGERARRAK